MVSWQPENGTRIGVMPRRGGADDITWYDIDPGHVQHFWNGWVEGDRIEFSGSRFDAPDFGIDPDCSSSTNPRRSTEPGRPARYWVDLAEGTAGWEPMDDLGGDFNRINDDPQRRTDPMAVHVGLHRTGPNPRRLRHDREVRRERRHPHDVVLGYPRTRRARTCSPPIPAERAEDDGWLLNVVYDDDRDASDLVVLDAHDIAAGPIATVQLPRRVPFGFHANWFGVED